jgi:hypothetical protein
MTGRTRRWNGFSACFFASAVAAVACSGKHDGGAARPDAGAPVLFGNGGFALGDASCVGSTSRAEAIPFDLYVLFDQSGSMSTPAGNGTRLDAVRAALADFLRAPESAGIGVGLGYFGNFPLGQTSCNPADYATPALPIADLPGAADALLASLNAVSPTGETPTGAAVRGACEYVKGWQGDHPGRSLAILLLTDGVPEAPISRSRGCDPTLPDAIAATQDCVNATGAKIYVLGVGPKLENLNQIAAAGGTSAAHLVTGTDVSGEVLAALDVIRGTALPCTFEIPAPPEGETLDFGSVNVIVTGNDGTEHGIYKVGDATACDAQRGGWYYTPASGTPQGISLCDASCEFVKAQSARGAIHFALGCATVSNVH